jgi:hypothetical protein
MGHLHSGRRFEASLASSCSRRATPLGPTGRWLPPLLLLLPLLPLQAAAAAAAATHHLPLLRHLHLTQSGFSSSVDVICMYGVLFSVVDSPQSTQGSCACINAFRILTCREIPRQSLKSGAHQSISDSALPS